ncbi:hypothetical protein BDZ45DRAFT_601202, partial [Acephala macrosclerotiorum]
MCSLIRFDSLPLTFQDAVTFCRLMGVYFLWIDALCIKQDDREDWEIESATMGQIYRNADFVLIAHSAVGDADGFLAKFHRKSSAVLLGSSNSKSGGVFEATLVDQASISISYSGLSRRGWIFQERLLARRAVHFLLGDILIENMGQQVLLGPEPISSHAFLDLWMGLVEGYSSCALTFSKDRISAITGVARVLHSKLSRQRFITGLWSQNFITQLLWLDNAKSSSVRVGQAPSWSWAS